MDLSHSKSLTCFQAIEINIEELQLQIAIELIELSPIGTGYLEKGPFLWLLNSRFKKEKGVYCFGNLALMKFISQPIKRQ